MTYLSFNGGLDLGVSGLVEGHPREEIVYEGHEEGLVFVHQLREVHVPQHPHHGRRLAVFGFAALRGAEGTQHGEDVTKTEVVVHLKHTPSRWRGCYEDRSRSAPQAHTQPLEGMLRRPKS